MSYDSALLTDRDRIRLITGDTTGDPVQEFFPDRTYDATLAMYSTWKLAAAAMAEAVAVKIEQDPSSFTAVGDVAVGWSDRTRSLRAQAVRLRQEAMSETSLLGTVVSIQATRAGRGSEGLEYSPRSYRRLER